MPSKKPVRSTFIEYAVIDLYARYRNDAKRRSVPFGISQERFKALITSPCTYCASPPSNRFRKQDRYANRVFLYSGIDRVCNEVGYFDGNCAACCQTCNMSKNKLSMKQWLTWLKRIAYRMGVCTLHGQRPNQDGTERDTGAPQ